MAEKKQFSPTTKRLKKARDKGEFPRGPILVKGIALLALVLVLDKCIRNYWVEASLLLQYTWARGYVSEYEVVEGWLELAGSFVGVIFMVVALSATLTERLQTGSLFSLSLVGLNFSRIDPAVGIQKIFKSMKQIPELVVRYLIMIAVFAFYIWQGVILLISNYGHIFSIDWGSLLGHILKGLTLGSVSLLLIGSIEYLLQRRRHSIDLSMSADEIKRESKEESGNSEVKGMRTFLHRQLLLQDIEKRVRASRVILVD